MKTRIEDIAADVAELDRHIMVAEQRAQDLAVQVRAAIAVRDQLTACRARLTDLAALHAGVQAIYTAALEEQRELAECPF